MNYSNLNKIYLFLDIDGVLIKNDCVDPSLKRGWDIRLKNEYNLEPELLSDHFFKKYFIDCLLGRSDLKKCLTTFLKKFNFPPIENIIMSYWFNYYSLDNNLLTIISFLRKNENVKLYLATNQEKYRAQHLWKNLGLDHYFLDIFYSGNLGVLKNNTDFFNIINQKLSINEENLILFFDDEPQNIQSATLAGWKAFLYKEINDIQNNKWLTQILRGI